MRPTAALAAPTAALILATCACTNTSSTPARGSATGETTAARSTTAAASDLCFDKGKGFAGEARLYIEHNATDRDTGFHGTFDQEGLAQGCIATPDGTPLMFIDTTNQLGTLGINQIFFESREPPNAVYSIADLKADFPEGEYRISGIDYQGTRRVGTAKFTHAIPAAPTIVEPKLVPEEKGPSNVVPSGGLTVRWEPVTRTVDGEQVSISGYEVIITKVEHADPHGLSRPVYDVHVPPNLTSLSVPDEFLEPKTLYELEVLALEDSGNQTITVGFFSTG
ncbi:MAG: hypothetical protein ACRDOY_11110 [Nocardioidaceae bacterium]